MTQKRLNEILETRSTATIFEDIFTKLNDIESKADHLIEALHSFRYRAHDVIKKCSCDMDQNEVNEESLKEE